MRFAPEPAYTHGTVPRTAVLLVNLGTPDAPTPAAVRRYLAEFLADPRVVEIPPLVWRPILHGIILRTRPAKSAEKYRSIWTPEGSPLMVWTDKQAKLLQGALGERGHRVTVRAAMRYGQPAIPTVLNELKAAGAERVLVVPAYPQYSGTTTASVADAVGAWAQRIRRLPELRFVNQYHDDPAYVDALVQRLRDHWMQNGRGERLVLSFHGVPRRTLDLGDPYHCQCQKTARLLAERLGLPPEQVLVTFQSRFGRAEWLKPYTEPTLQALARQGIRHVDVACPGFVADCLETLEEIDLEVRQAFLAAGGREFHYVRCLNDHPAWVRGLATIAERHLAGWPTRETDPAAAAAAQRDRALKMGAAR